MKMQLLDGGLFCSDHLFPIIFGLLIAALLGWLLKHFLSGGATNSDLQSKYDRLAADFHEERERYNKLFNDSKKKKNSGNDALAMGAAVAGSAAFASNNKEVENLNVKIKNLKAELNAASENNLKLISETNNAKLKAKEAITLNSEVETLKVRLEGLTRALETSKADAEKYKIDYEAANGERSRLSVQLAQSDIGEMQKRIERLENNLDTSRITVANLQSENEILKNGAKTVNTSYATTSNSGADVNAQLKEAKAEIEKLQLSNARMNKEIETANLKINVAVNDATAKSNKEVSELRSKIKMAENNIAKLETDLKSALAITQSPVNIEPVKANEPTIVEETKIVETKEAIIEPIKQEIVVEKLEHVILETPKVEEVKVSVDDIKIIEGIGPVLEKRLNDAGITTLKQIADSSSIYLKDILEASGDKLHDPTSWPMQAQLLVDGKIEEFKELCERLKGGRIVD